MAALWCKFFFFLFACLFPYCCLTSSFILGCRRWTLGPILADRHWPSTSCVLQTAWFAFAQIELLETIRGQRAADLHVRFVCRTVSAAATSSSAGLCRHRPIESSLLWIHSSLYQLHLTAFESVPKRTHAHAPLHLLRFNSTWQLYYSRPSHRSNGSIDRAAASKAYSALLFFVVHRPSSSPLDSPVLIKYLDSGLRSIVHHQHHHYHRYHFKDKIDCSIWKYLLTPIMTAVTVMVLLSSCSLKNIASVFTLTSLLLFVVSLCPIPDTKIYSVTLRFKF